MAEGAARVDHPVCLRWVEWRAFDEGPAARFSCECAGEGCPNDPRVRAAGGGPLDDSEVTDADRARARVLRQAARWADDVDDEDVVAIARADGRREVCAAILERIGDRVHLGPRTLGDLVDALHEIGGLSRG